MRRGEAAELQDSMNTSITRILQDIENGDPHAASELLPLVYEELRVLARHRLANERPGQTLQPTALVHEAYLRLIGKSNDEGQWSDRGHFFAAAAEAMRRILIDQARRKQSRKHGGGAIRVPADVDSPIATDPVISPDELLELDAALREFEKVDPIRAQLVKLRYFAGLSLKDTADAMDISLATAKRYWVYARSWLFGKIRES